MRLFRAVIPLFAMLLSACPETVRFRPQEDAGPICEEGQRLVQGLCQFVCQRDSDCAAGQRCNLFSGQCEPKPLPIDAGPEHLPCTEGAVRCSADGHMVEKCDALGTWGVETTCPQPDGYCQNEVCLACRPGSARCTASSGAVEICKDDGSGYRTVTCAVGATCVQSECRECAPGQTRCSPDNTSLQTCTHSSDETKSWTFVNSGDNYDGTCITHTCEQGLNGPQCHPPACVPGSTTCLSAAVQQTCTPLGSWQNTTCSTTSPNAECVNGACVDECGDAVAAKSYFGCEYWTAILDNVVTASTYKAGVTSGQGTTDSEFAFVVSNRSNVPTTVKVERFYGGVVATLKTVTVPARTDPSTKGVSVIKVPWQSIGTSTDDASTSGQQKYAYHLTTNHPVTVYQFNPLPAQKTQGTCATSSSCTLDPNGTCVNGACTYYSFSNDASLLLPAHILGTSYVGVTPEHVAWRNGTSPTSTAMIGFNGMLTIVGTQAGTTVTVKSNALTRAGGTVAAIAKGTSHTFTLNAYDVLQLASDNPSNITSAASNIECGNNPYDQGDPSCWFPPCTKLCRVDSDLTGSVITSDKPVAVFGGSSCTLRGYLETACDHVEEQLFPFVTWGKHFVGTRTPPLRLTSGGFATPGNAGPDYYKVVAGCPVSQCPNGTAVTITPPPAAADVLLPNRCLTGTLSTNTCKLAGGSFMEFRMKSSIEVSADQPIEVAQIFAGQNATTGTDRPAQGDPSLVLLPPVEQWRNNYTVLTAPGIKDNYVAVVFDSTKVQSIQVDGATISGFQPVGSTAYRFLNVPVTVGTHTVSVNSKPGISPIPGAGVTVLGFDNYVSYGYTGGLDLGTIVSGINPGG